MQTFRPRSVGSSVDRLSADLPALLYITLPCQTVSAYRRRPVDQLVADALPRRERVMLNSSRDEATRRRELALARFAPLRELTPARGIRLERSPEGNAPSPTAGSRCRECSRPAAHGRFWTLMRKRSQLRSVASTVRYHLPKMRAAISVHRFVSRSHQFK